MEDITVRCVCGREMRALITQGPGHYRCGTCRTRVHVAIPVVDPDPHRCGITVESKRCTGRRARDLDVCRDHLNGLLITALGDPEAREYIIERLGRQEFARLETEARDRWERKREENSRRVAAMRPDCPVVYYVRLDADHIKIGTSVYLPQRMGGLRVRSRDQVLAAEPGDREVEKRRHDQFGHLRYHHLREDFRPGEDLLAHIAGVRERHGPPYELAARMLAEAREEAEARLLAEGW